MTILDFNIEFDLLYNNALSNSAAEINLYEKSLFLTQAQEEIIKEAYNSKISTGSFESNEAIRKRLEPLVITKVSAYDPNLNSQLQALKIDSDSKFFAVESDIWYTVFERCNTSTKQVYIIPIQVDKFNVLKDNPFKKPNKKKAWKLNLLNSVNSTKVVEIVSTENVVSYVYRYLKEPTPIVLCDLATEYAGENLSINGITAETECALNSEVHRTILKRAVELATIAYKENTLQNNVQLNNRNN